MTGQSSGSGAVTRRTALKGMAAATVAGPWFVRSKTLAASSGQINVLMWSDYRVPGLVSSFEAETGVKVNYTGIGSNEETIAKMRAAGGRGVDLCSPTSMRSPQWETLGLLQPIDYGRLKNIGNLNSAMRRIGDEDWNFGGEGSHWLPHVWGTEGISWRTDLWNPPRAGEMPSYGDLWQDDVRGRMMVRPHSGMLGTGLYLEAVGDLEPGAMRRAYRDEKTMRATWQKVTDFCIENKAQVKLFWNDADTLKNGLLNDGVVVGQTWDGPSISMMLQGEAVQYRAPVEGALAWVDGLALSAAAENLDAVYAFIDHCLDVEVAGKSIDGGAEGSAWGGHGYNSAVVGADRYASSRYAEVFASVYPNQSLANLWPWPKEPQWYADARTEFRNRFVNA